MTPVELWLTALRSGEYQQARGYLHTDEGYCCLGVACDIYRKETGKGEWAPSNSNDYTPRYAFVLGCTDQELGLPDEVAAWLGLESNMGDYVNDEERTLADENDAGTTFEQIAEIIESRPPGLFSADTAL